MTETRKKTNFSGIIRNGNYNTIGQQILVGLDIQN